RIQEALGAVFPATTLQTCIVHLIRNSLDYAAWDKRRALAKALKPIYQAINADVAEQELNAFEAGPWLQIAREQIPEQVLKEGKVAGKVTLGEGGDYANLDALVHDTKQMVDERVRDGGDLIAIIGSDLLAADKAKLYAKQGDLPTEKERIEDAQVIATYGGLPSFSVPFFPVNAVVVTSFDNLSIYFQDSSWRKQTIDNPKRSRVEDYNSRNEGYVIEQLEKFAMTENVELVKA
ncbi:P2 family phage major capsid protein, partial [Pseudomonas amygdali]